MLNDLKRLFREFVEDSYAGTQSAPITLEIATAVLLVEAAAMDETFEATERDMIKRLLAERFSLQPEDVASLIGEAEARVADTDQYHPFIDRISKDLSIAERGEIIEMMWRVAYADGEIDTHEDALLRQVAGLLHVPDRDRGLARQRARAAASIEDDT
ncbi:MAG: TerB family tellurite resistance protein [Pseudomonadota bacterium]